MQNVPAAFQAKKMNVVRESQWMELKIRLDTYGFELRANKECGSSSYWHGRDGSVFLTYEKLSVKMDAVCSMCRNVDKFMLLKRRYRRHT
ncbi:hypothetical protein NPIL_531651 [Nephila pilipes]|uniref:Uncharacterized protein n=1 Tax=Nephila pilipes TaxID=299642 RepID=A0A8X6Q1T4_NEPPI|nr:hypothetical protein NPIL_531651 [Nephila pilipes]